MLMLAMDNVNYVNEEKHLLRRKNLRQRIQQFLNLNRNDIK